MKKSILTAVAVLALLALLMTAALRGLNLGFAKVDAVRDGIVLGLDLVGGSEITYEAKIPAGATREEIDQGMQIAQSMLRQRLNDLGYTEAALYLAAGDRIVVEIPAVGDPEQAVQQLGKTAVVTFEDADGNVVLSGGDIKSATYENSQVEGYPVPVYHVVLNLTDEGTAKFTEATRAAANQAAAGRNYISIVMDGEVISRPGVSAQYAGTGINTSTATITMGADATLEEVRYLSELISAGQLPFTLEHVKLQSVGASLGERSLETSLRAGLIGLVLVCVFMLALYRVMGLISCVALMLYASAFAVAASLAHLNLSLPGIAGVILTVGMAVDANVVIYERIKEELRLGKTLRYAIDAGYRRAVSAIIDSNITTIIAAAVLWIFGTGTILSFAQTLLIGVVLSMVIMLFFTKLLLKTAVGLKITNLWAYCA